MKAIWISVLVACVAALSNAESLCPAAALSSQRIVLSTTLGDLVIALYPGAAPRHAEQILKLMRLGVYDTTHFHKIDLGFAAQLSGVGRRRLPMTGEQQAAIHPLKAEFNACQHHYGTVSMAHDPENPDSAQTSFLILLADLPQMDGKFTVVGEVVGGKEVLESISLFPIGPGSLPLKRIEVEKTKVWESAEALAAATPAPASEKAEEEEKLPSGFAHLAFALFSMGLFLSLISWRMKSGLLRAIGLLSLLAGYFQLFVLLAPNGAESPASALGLFLSAIALFKVMTYFERPTQDLHRIFPQASK